ncbi:MAD2L1-binding protein [Elysia marginata]|uniref:MAD2L1-binding protein n=1 Tax=Elysia marginata TaxID=1093978 RepID=A0AAV4JTD6_9GAST|nr:MAD2L1-binding protein [Elysia marginata]
MAGVSKIHSHEIIFDGALLSTTRASLVTELLQYFLYERQQIPLPVDQLRSVIDNARPQRSSDDNGIGRDGDLRLRPHSDCTVDEQEIYRVPITTNKFSSSAPQFRKVGNLLDELCQLSEKLRQAFETCPEIEQVAVLFGGTVVSPKESYVIKFPPPCPDADSLPLKSCKRNLFQQVISEDFLGSLTTTLAPTNVTVLISAPRTCPLQWFLPKQTLKSPKLGTIINFNFHCDYLVPICHDLTMADGEFELSGLELLDCSQCGSEGSSTLEEEPNSKNSPKDDSKNLAEAGTASCISDAAFQLSSRHPEPDAVSCSTVREKKHSDEGASPSPFLPRFCKHQRPNYIYSSKKHSYIKDKDLTANDSVAAKASGSSPSSDDFQHPIVHEMKHLRLSPHHIAGDQTDCIWYQSPIVIKGLKKQDLFAGKK